MTKLADRRHEELFKRVAEIIEAARGHVVRTVSSAMVQAYWLIGREIVYEIEALREAWSARELERQIASLLFERLAKSREDHPARGQTAGRRRA